MANHTAPDDPKKFTMTVFIAFVVVFVVAMIMMLMHGKVKYSSTGARDYQTEVKEP